MAIEAKIRILYVLKYLWENTDEEHFVTTNDIVNVDNINTAINAKKKISFKYFHYYENNP